MGCDEGVGCDFAFFPGISCHYFSAYLPVFCRAFPQPGASPQPSPEGEGEAPKKAPHDV